MELCWDATLTRLSRRLLSAPLALSDAGILSTVVL